MFFLLIMVSNRCFVFAIVNCERQRIGSIAVGYRTLGFLHALCRDLDVGCPFFTCIARLRDRTPYRAIGFRCVASSHVSSTGLNGFASGVVTVVIFVYRHVARVGVRRASRKRNPRRFEISRSMGFEISRVVYFEIHDIEIPMAQFYRTLFPTTSREDR